MRKHDIVTVQTGLITAVAATMDIALFLLYKVGQVLLINDVVLNSTLPYVG